MKLLHAIVGSNDIRSYYALIGIDPEVGIALSEFRKQKHLAEFYGNASPAN